MVLYETDVITRLDASIRSDTDEWPEFALNQVRVTAQGTGDPVSLLAAHGGFFVTVEGVLEEIDKHYVHLAKSSDYRNRPITISNVATYSFSLFEDGSFGFWAAGQAGWFELKSAAKDFKKTFAGMKEATGMFYYLADKYKNSRAKYSGASAKVLQDHVVKRLFNNYIYSEYCQRESLESITEGFYHHREFLMKSMLEGQEGLPWLDSPVLRHYRQKFPDEYKAIKEIGETTQIGQIPKQSTSTTVGALAQASKAAIREEENTFKQPLVWEVEMLDDVALIENSENEQSDYMSDSHKRESILRPRSNRASKKFMSRRENTRSASKKEASQNDEIEDGDSCIRVVDNLELATQPEPTRSLPPQIKKKTKKVAQSSKHGVWSNDAKTPLPAYYEPRGPGDTWICPYDGCMRKVWDARGAASVEMIKDHWVKTHANDAESLISEESRPWVSVDNLLERVKSIASLRAQVAPSQPGLPSRIIRRY